MRTPPIGEPRYLRAGGGSYRCERARDWYVGCSRACSAARAGAGAAGAGGAGGRGAHPAGTAGTRGATTAGTAAARLPRANIPTHARNTRGPGGERTSRTLPNPTQARGLERVSKTLTQPHEKDQGMRMQMGVGTYHPTPRKYQTKFKCASKMLRNSTQSTRRRGFKGGGTR